MYGKKYQWIFNGWYSHNWIQILSTDCTPEQMATAAQYALPVDSLTYDMSNQAGISGQVTRKCMPLNITRPILISMSEL